MLALVGGSGYGVVVADHTSIFEASLVFNGINILHWATRWLAASRCGHFSLYGFLSARVA